MFDVYNYNPKSPSSDSGGGKKIALAACNWIIKGVKQYLRSAEAQQRESVTEPGIKF